MRRVNPKMLKGKALLRSQVPCWHPSTLCRVTAGMNLAPFADTVMLPAT